MRRSPLQRRTGLKQGKPLARTASPRRARHARRQSTLERDLRTLWYGTLFDSRGRRVRCAVCGHRPAEHVHHIVREQVLRRELQARLTPQEMLFVRFALANAMPCCQICHASQHSRSRPIPMALLRRKTPAVFAFAAEHGLGWVLAHDYPDGP